ncbi:hypothetical protein O181_089573 [Austropuccinia psidii MF-1]|uniref:Uncharacterized protein n=1 Tax=Austropuccinia psidii MF-1 TaxID=1389203 RepID=A0A9Q3P501_9BASI|nr:hypothetical protein [Austropuccinia psidii MF-1]
MPNISKKKEAIKHIIEKWDSAEKEKQKNSIYKLLGLQVIHTIESILSPSNITEKIIWDLIYNKANVFRDAVGKLLQSRYLERNPVMKFNELYDIEFLFSMRDEYFKQSVRTTKEVFIHLNSKIKDNLIFQNNCFNKQLPVSHQLAFTLERIGSNGNGTSVGRIAQNLKIGRGTVVMVSRKVLCAINSLDKE